MSAGSSAGSTSVPGSSRSSRTRSALVDLPAFVGRLDRQAAPGGLGLRAIDLDGRGQVGRDLLGQFDQFLGATKGFDRPADLTARLLHVEVGLGHLQSDVVADRLGIGFASPANLPRGKRRVTGIADGKDCRWPGADEDRRTARGEDVAHDVLDLPIVPEIIDPEADVGQPEDLRSIELGACGP